MKKFLLLTSMVLSVLISEARDFTYKNINYTITDAKAKTCMTRAGTYMSDYTGNIASGRLELPETVYDGDVPYTLTAIGELSFNQQSITSLILPNTITEIHTNAFYKCEQLTEVTIPASLKKIGIGGFNINLSLKRINITDLAAWCAIEFAHGSSNPLYDGGRSGFLYLNGKKISEQLVIPEGVTSISNYAFNNYSGLESLTIPSTVETIGAEAFSGCNSLSSVTINAEALQSVGERAFYNVSKVKELNISSIADLCKVSLEEGLASICSYDGNVNFVKDNVTLDGSRSTPKFVIPEGVKTIGAHAFDDMKLYGGISLPNSLESIGPRAFRSTVTMGDNYYSLTIPNSVTEIGDYAFYSCYNISSVTIGESVSSIGKCAFGYSGLKSLYIPASVTNIEWNAFEYVKSITSITYDTKSPKKFFQDLFTSDVCNKATVYVPVGVKAKIENLYPWQKFKNIEEKSSTLNVGFNSGGQILYGNEEISSGSQIPPVAEGMSFMIIPELGYRVDEILMNGVNASNVEYDPVKHTCVLYPNTNSIRNNFYIRFSKIGEATLVVSSPKNHTVSYKCPEQSDITVSLEPESGWSLHSATLNGEPVQFNNDSSITISSITGFNELNVIYIQDGASNIEDVETAETPISINVANNILTVHNKSLEEPVFVYDLSGNMIVSTTDDETYLPVSNTVAIIKVANKVFKVAIR